MNKKFRIVLAVILLLATLYSAWGFYQITKATAESFVPNVYTQQWQRAMAWVRDNTAESAVFAHWWDYGYWVQTIGQRATVLDGGNAIGYWNHLMGRHVLTGTDNMASLEYLYTHNATHLLIDSTDIGKYGAFSSIGSGVELDRASFIPTFQKDPAQTQERRNSTVSVYMGGVGLDEDIIYEVNGSRIFLPSGSAGLGAILIEQYASGETGQPIGVFVYQGVQYQIPFRYAFDGEFHDFGTGIEHGVFLFPKMTSSAQGQQLDPTGAMFYLSSRTVKSQLARLYLYEENNPYFRLAHSEDDIVVSQLKSLGYSNSSFVLFDQFRGPIRIWEIEYPAGMEINETYLQTNYPDPRLNAIP